MSLKKKAESLKNKPAIEEMRSFVVAGQATQEAVEQIEDPMQILDHFGEKVMDFCRKIKQHQPYFQEKKINPYHRLQVICQEKCLFFQDNFDKVAGLKAGD